MLIGSDCCLNLVLGFDDPLQKVLSQTMLDQEEIFRNQVLELHRLYEIQKILMKERDLNMSGGERSHSLLGPSSKNVKYGYVATEMKSSEAHTICSYGSVKNHCLLERNGPLKHERIPLDLELPASYYTNDSEDLLCDSVAVLDAETWPNGSGVKNMSTKRKLFTAHEVGELDLNKAIPDDPDESSIHQINHWISNPSKCTSSYVSHNEAGEYAKSAFLTDNHSNDSSASDHQDITRSTLTTSASKDDPVSCFVNFRPKNAESEISLSDKSCRNISTSEINVDKNKKDRHCSQELLECTGSNRSPVSCKSDWTADDVSSNTKTGQCGVEMKSQLPDPKKEESAEVDITVRKGAVSLIYFSSECFAKKRKESRNFERETPQSSSESYESIVLKQQECSVDEYCVSSTPFEATSPDKKEHGVKLRRGRRMKDFRKDILPGLASLSRQEISEDIKIMELAFRSREYKKYRPKNASRSDCFSPIRSRRSRLSCVGGRY